MSIERRYPEQRGTDMGDATNSHNQGEHISSLLFLYRSLACNITIPHYGE